MSTKRTRQLGNKYIAPEDIKNIINSSDEENSNSSLSGDNNTPKLDFNGTSGTGTGNEFLSCVDDLGNSEEDNASVYSVDKENTSSGSLYASKGSPAGSKLNTIHSIPQSKKSICNYFNTTSEESLRISKDVEKDESSEYLTGSGDSVSYGKICEEGGRHTKSGSEDVFLSYSGRKRNSVLEIADDSFRKRFRIELDKDMNEIPVDKDLKIELKLENMRRNEPFIRRDINTIIEELDLISRKWKEGYSKYKVPIQWGAPIFRNFNDKWDLHYISQKWIERCHKHLESSVSNSLNQASVSSPERGENEYRGTETNPDGNRVQKVDEVPKDILGRDFNTSNHLEGDMNLLNSDSQEKMTLRSRVHNRNRSEDGSNDGGGELKDKFNKKGSSKENKKNKRKNAKMELNVKARQCPYSNIKAQNDNDENDSKNTENLNIEDYGDSSSPSGNASKSDYHDNSSAGTTRQEEQFACPICNKVFDKDQIVTHATHCATETFND